MDDMLMVCLILTVIYSIASSLYIHKTNKRIKEFNSVLLEIESGKSEQKFLMKKNNAIDKVGFTLNAILYKYEKIIEESNITLESNKQLLTSLSHDVRTPMTTLIGYLDALDLRLVDQNKQTEYIKLAKEKAYDLKDYIDVLFDWFRLSSDEERINMEIVDIIELTREILMDWVAVLEERRIEYDIQIPESVVNVEIDGNCYERILNNIIQNIIVHSKANRITIIAASDSTRFTLKICDNGIGIEKEDLKFIFERLYKCNEGRSEKGNGLGLNIAKILTEKMNGEIKASSEWGKGTMFSVDFPIQ